MLSQQNPKPPNSSPESRNIVPSPTSTMTRQRPERVEAVTREEVFEKARKNPSVRKGPEAKEPVYEVKDQQVIQRWFTFLKSFLLMFAIFVVVGAILHNAPFSKLVNYLVMAIFSVPTFILPFLYKDKTYVLADYERLGIFSWGIWDGIKGPGTVILKPLSQSIARRIDLQERTINIPINQGVMLTHDKTGLVPVRMSLRLAWAVGNTPEQIEKACLKPTEIDIQVIKEAEVAVTEWMKMHPLMDISKPDESTQTEVAEEIIKSFAAANMKAILQKNVEDWGVVITKEPEASDIKLSPSLTDQFENLETAPAVKRILEILSEATDEEMDNITTKLQSLYPNASDMSIMRATNEVLIFNRITRASDGNLKVLSLTDLIRSGVESGDITEPV